MSERLHELHIVCGPPACGKSVCGRRLAVRLGAAFFDSDTATERVVRAGMRAAGLVPDDRDSPTYKRHFREPVYETLFALAEENLPHLPVVLAGPFTRESQDATWPARLRHAFGREVTVHFVWCDPAERRRRMELRGMQRDRAKLAEWARYLESCARERPPFPHQWIDTGTSEA